MTQIAKHTFALVVAVAITAATFNAAVTVPLQPAHTALLLA